MRLQVCKSGMPKLADPASPRVHDRERDGERLLDERDDLVREAIEEGLTYGEIAALAGPSHQRVSQIANE
jgi:hypothetical protein